MLKLDWKCENEAKNRASNICLFTPPQLLSTRLVFFFFHEYTLYNCNRRLGDTRSAPFSYSQSTFWHFHHIASEWLDKRVENLINGKIGFVLTFLVSSLLWGICLYAVSTLYTISCSFEGILVILHPWYYNLPWECRIESTQQQILPFGGYSIKANCCPSYKGFLFSKKNSAIHKTLYS